MQSGILRWWRNLRLKTKIMVICCSGFCFAVLISLLGSGAVLNIYNEQFYKLTADVLAGTCGQLEEKLEMNARLSEYIVSDAQLQSSLSALDFSGELEQIQIARQLYQAFPGNSVSNKYVVQFTIFCENGQAFTVGKDSSPESPEIQKTALETARANQGQEGWIATDRDDGSVLCVRAIREVKNLSLKTLGVLVMRVDLEQMVQDALSESSLDMENRMVALRSGDKLLYTNGDPGSIPEFTFSPGPGKYEIVRNGQNLYFLVGKTMKSIHWSYFEYVPYHQIFHYIVTACIVLLLSAAVASVLTVLFVRRLSGSVTRHFNLLVEKMNLFRLTSQAADLEPEYRERKDEAGELHRNFNFMAQEINRLIENNYVKQLLIKDSQLKALEQQINPHFLYNTLESINWLAKINKQQQISQMAESLGLMLRFTLSEKQDVVTIRSELTMIENYIRIQQIRYQDRLYFTMELDEGLLEETIPKMSIQPLVENVIHHALEQVEEPCKIAVRVGRKDGLILIEVENNGPNIEEDVLEKLEHQGYQPRGHGIGLLNIDKRVKLIFGEQYGLAFRNLDGGVCARLTIPPAAQRKDGASCSE